MQKNVLITGAAKRIGALVPGCSMPRVVMCFCITDRQKKPLYSFVMN